MVQNFFTGGTIQKPEINDAEVWMQDEKKEGDDFSGFKARQVLRKSLRSRLTQERREFEQMLFERQRRQGSDRFWRLR